MSEQEQIIELLLNNPVEYAKALGFDKLGALHNEWIKAMINNEEDYTLQAHRGSYKTTCVSIALVIIIIVYRDAKTLFLRKTDEDVKEVIKQVKKALEHPITIDLVHRLYGTRLELTVDNATQLSTNLCEDIKGTPQLWAFGIGASITGKHFDRIFTDDIVNLADRTSRAERKRTIATYQELHNLKNRGGKIFNTGTPWHAEDCFSIMPEPVKYDCYSTGLISKEEIEELKSKMTQSLFSANYELKHIADEDVIFTSPQTGADTELVKNGYSHCDAAFYGEDYTAFTICAIHDGKFYVYGRCWRKHIDDVMNECVLLHKNFLCNKLLIEKNADKGYVANKFKEKGLRVYPYNESENKYVKITTELKFEWNNVVFVKGTDPEYINQICDYNENAEHDDCPDSLASLVRALSKSKNKKPYQSAW